MNDIQLQKNMNDKYDLDTYDWMFRDDDVVSASLYERTRNKIIHSLLLRRYESEVEWYTMKGSEIYAFIKDVPSKENEFLLTEEIKLICNSIDEIESTQVSLTRERGELWTVNIIATRKDGITVEL